MGEIYQSLRIRWKRTIRIEAFIDTGADTSIIKEKYANQAGLPKIRNSYVFFGGTIRVPSIKSAMFVLVGKRETISPVEIVKNHVIDKNLILGQDFLQNKDVVIDYRIDKIRLLRKKPKYHRL